MIFTARKFFTVDSRGRAAVKCTGVLEDDFGDKSTVSVFWPEGMEETYGNYSCDLAHIEVVPNRNNPGRSYTNATLRNLELIEKERVYARLSDALITAGTQAPVRQADLEDIPD